jgi:hypothetical protein
MDMLYTISAISGDVKVSSSPVMAKALLSISYRISNLKHISKLVVVPVLCPPQAEQETRATMDRKESPICSHIPTK